MLHFVGKHGLNLKNIHTHSRVVEGNKQQMLAICFLEYIADFFLPERANRKKRVRLKVIVISELELFWQQGHKTLHWRPQTIRFKFTIAADDERVS